MKLSKLWSISILIALALFLNAASDGTAASNKRPEKHRENPSAQAKTVQQQPQVPLSALRSSQAALLEAVRTIKVQAEAQREHERAEREHERAENEGLLSPSRVQKGLLAVGVFYTIFAALQWAAIRRQVELVRDIEAPYLSILIEPHGFPPVRQPSKPIYVDYWFQNDGRTPALIQEIGAEIALVPTLPAKPTYSKQSSYPTSVVAIGPNHSKGPLGRVPYEMTDSDWQKNRDSTYKWHFFGYIKYADAMVKTETIFGFGFQLDASKNAFLMIEDLPYN